MVYEIYLKTAVKKNKKRTKKNTQYGVMHVWV